MMRPLLVMTLLTFGAAAGFAARTSETDNRKALLDQDRRFAAATAARGLEGYLSFFAEDASVLPGNSPVISGKDRIRRYYSRAFSSPDFSFTWSPMASDASQSGDLGYTWGTYEATFRDRNGELRRSRGKYTSIWKKQPDGSWKVVADIGNMEGSPGVDPCIEPEDDSGIYVISQTDEPPAHRVPSERCII